MSTLDYIIIVIYMAGTLGLGFWCMKDSRDADSFMVARGKIGGWIVGLSIFGTYVSSISFLALPGKAVVGDWNFFVFSLSLPFAAWIGASLFVPFYRKLGQVSAYEHMESRFGSWARIYMSVCFMLLQVARVGSVMYLIALVMNQLLAWDMITIIVIIGGLTTLYTCIGGLEGVVLTDALQSLVLILGALLSVIWLPFAMPEGPGQMMEIALENNKFSLGSWNALDWTDSTVWVVMLYALATNLQNVAINQSYTQRYLSATTEAEAKKSVWFGSLLYVPVSAGFFFIGTALFCYYTAQPGLLPEDLHTAWQEGKGDEIFPYFIMSTLPTGVRGVMVAAILAAAMSTISSSLNSSAALTLSDIFQRLIHPNPTETQSMMVLYGSTVIWGTAGTVLAIAMIDVKSAMDAWWSMSGVISGGMLGLFLLGFFSKRAGTRSAIVGVVVGIVIIGWLTFSPDLDAIPESLSNPLNGLLTIVLGTIAIVVTGTLFSYVTGDRDRIKQDEPVAAETTASN
ncbi:sodium:solute symporter [Bremerella cremea]|uniref:Sodium:solute symporter n=1 Tax=Blastopirellula marina TaxID=124 RepID=A0A2S8G7Q0_9BACT|nr:MULTISPECIES: sodium:solute symporter [Pirellulaceae]PQO40486.1 sodium:solute symporter [Blastopirellula marina]RCS52068.1 sodium:solute symporter [Bremerella cremea]